MTPDERHPDCSWEEEMKKLLEDLASILGSTYGGPSLSYEHGRWIIYGWFDAPVGMEHLGEGETLEEAVAMAKERKEPSSE